MGGAGHLHPLPMRFIDDGLLFLERDRRAAVRCRREVIHVDLDEVSTVFDLYPHLLSTLPRRVHEVKITRPGSRPAHPLRGDDHPRTFNDAFVDRVTQVHVRGAATRQIPRGGKARHEVELGIFGSEQRDIRHGKRRPRLNDRGHRGFRPRAGVVADLEHVVMALDQARQHRARPEIDLLRTGRSSRSRRALPRRCDRLE